MLPDVKTQYLSASTSDYAQQRQPRRDYGEIVQVLGTTILTSTAFSAIIKAYLDHKRTILKIKIGPTELEFEGPSLKESAEDIEIIIENVIQTVSRARPSETPIMTLAALPKSEKVVPKPKKSKQRTK